AHRHDVVHRDIKPENILLEERHAVVADFGIARAISVAGGEKLTATGVAVGTPEYMSPEQASGRGELDGRSDVYGLGCVLYEMLAGQPPFMGRTVEAVLRQHMTAPAPAVTAIREGVPTPVTSAIQRALAKTPTDRFATALQFGEAIAQPVTLGVPWWRSRRVAVALPVVAVLAVAGWWMNARDRGDVTSAEDGALPRLAVLPFENLGAPEDEFFADGITDEIITKLAGLSGLAVISSQTARQLKGTDETPAQISKKLGVQYLVQGSVRWQRVANGPSRVRVTPRLIDIADDRHLWAADFDEDLEDIFRIQGQIATHVAEALGVTLLKQEQEAAAARPTQDSAAYELYLRGNAYFWVGFPLSPRLRDAADMYQRAVDRDPTFAAAHARLSMVHGSIRAGGGDPGREDEHLGKQRLHADHALALDSALPEAHVAMGYYHYQGRRDYEAALQEFEIALAAEPNNSSFMVAKAIVLKRTGAFAAAAELNARGSDRDPLNWATAVEAWINYSHLRRHHEAQRYIDRAASLQKASGDFQWQSAYTRLSRDGDVTALRQWLRISLGDTGVAQVVAEAAHGGGFRQQGWALVRALCGPCDAAIPLVRSGRERDWQQYYGKALLYERAGRLGVARAYYDSARVREEELGRFPFWAYAKLRRKHEAVTAAQEVLERAGRDRDVAAQAYSQHGLAEVYVILGEYDAALERLEWLLSHPSFISVPLLRADPLYDPLRSNPRFQALLAKYDTPRD
ncbi:MAG: protein kinase, partial [Gemmatimonadetes bacterium]|nr:protein kinase [Gemmatimonadota bacterium]